MSRSKRDEKKQDAASGEDLLEALIPIAFITMAALNKIGAENDLSLTVVRVLGILRDRRLRVTDLANYLGLEKQTVSGLITRSEKQGLVARAPSTNDGRSVEVHLTSEGADLFDRLHRQAQQALAPLTEPLSPSDQRLLQELLERMLESRQF